MARHRLGLLFDDSGARLVGVVLVAKGRAPEGVLGDNDAVLCQHTGRPLRPAAPFNLRLSPFEHDLEA